VRPKAEPSTSRERPASLRGEAEGRTERRVSGVTVRCLAWNPRQ
jgi:hypothetical protein